MFAGFGLVAPSEAALSARDGTLSIATSNLQFRQTIGLEAVGLSL